MRAIIIKNPGRDATLVPVERPAPEPGPGEVVVAVAAVGVNRADVLQRRGLYPAPAGAPADIPGLEFSGTICRLGEGARGHAVGDRVMGLVPGGAYAEQVVLHARELMPVPRSIDLVDAAAIPEAFATAWDAMHLQGGLRAGQSVLIHAVASGVGSAAMQLARASGARAIGTSRTPAKLLRCAELGLDHGIDTSEGSFADAARALVPEGVDLVLDLVGGEYVKESLGALRASGTMICVGLLAGARAELPMGLLLSRRLTLRGTVLRSRPLEEKIALARAFSREVVPLFDSGALCPIIDQRLPLEEARAAHDALESNTTFGKVLLTT